MRSTDPSFPNDSILHFDDWREVEALRCRIMEHQTACRERARREDFRFEFDPNRTPSPEEEARANRWRAVNGQFWSWLNENRSKYDGHEYRPGFDAYVDLFLQNEFDITKISVVGTYVITTPPPCTEMELPIIRLEKDDLVIDVVHDFGIGNGWCLRLRGRGLDLTAFQPFTHREFERPDGVEHLPPAEGPQTILFVASEHDLHAVLILLLGRGHD
jgi:hypothetical protein